MTYKYISLKYYPEIDIIRGLTVVAMIIFHTCFQLQLIFQQNLTQSIWFWKGMPMMIGGSFLTLVGLSFYIGKNNGKYTTTKELLKRSASLFGLGMGLTLVTFIAKQGGYVYFGILHCIGLSTLISYYTLPWPKSYHLIVGIMIICAGIAQEKFAFIPFELVWTFFLWPCHSKIFHHLDYYPVIPSLGFVFIGIFLGKVLYNYGKRTFKLDISKKLLAYTFPIRWLGRNALLIYCIHTPIIFICIYIILSIKKLVG